MKTRTRLAALALLALAACASTHIDTYKPKRRDYALPDETTDAAAKAAPGSLFQDGSTAAMLFTDARALRVNDLVVVKIEEVADARRTADTELSRETDNQLKIGEFLGLMARLKQVEPRFDPNINGGMTSHFKGDGQTGRTERLTATVPAMVRKVMPNGNLFIEGHRVILVNAEEHHFYISGVVRPIDIDQENSVKSSMIADAEIEFTGRGVLSDNQKPGWMSRFLTWIWPF